MVSQDTIAITAEPFSEAQCRFTVDRPVYAEKSFAFNNVEEAQGSPLAERLFAVEGVSHVVIFHNQVTVKKSIHAEWPVIGRQIGAAIREHLGSGEPAVADAAWERVPPSDVIRARVQEVLDQEVNPAVAGHGGVVRLIDVKDNQVFIQLGGGCQGCGQANVTLKFGVENAIRNAVPSVGEILDVTDHAAGQNPYYAPSGK